MTGKEVTVSEALYEDTSEGMRQRLGETYDKIRFIIKRYLDIKEEFCPLIALWIIGTYIHKEFNAYPFLYLNAQRGSGKTRLLKIISHLSYKSFGQVQTGITESVLFRSDKGATLVLDECESIASKEKAALREYLNASYKRGSIVKRNKKIKKTTEEGYELETFEPFRPIALANIYGMNDVLGDRCLTLVLEKSNNAAKTKLMENFDNNPNFFEITRTLNDIRVGLCREVLVQGGIEEWNTYILDKYTYTPTLSNIPTLPYTSLHEFFVKIDDANIDGRNLELMFPLLMLSNYLGSEARDEMLEIARKIIESKREQEFTEDKDVALIDFVASRENLRFVYIHINELTIEFRKFLGEYDDSDRWLQAAWVGKALRRLNLIGKHRRKARGAEVLLAVDRAKEKKLMYRPPEDNDED